MSDPLPQAQQQPVLVYPNSVNVQPQSQDLSHSKGSFGASFIVLAVIIVVSAAACFLSRLCNKRGQKHKEPKQEKSHKQKKGQGGPPYPIHPTFPPQQSRRKEMDMEFGFGPGGGGPGRQQHQPKANDIEFGFDKKSGRPKGGDIEMGFDKRFPSGKGPQHADMMRGVKPYPNGVMKGETNPHFNGGHWGGQ
uniref:Uncharacterized protein n=1 Tax=Kalanchoe fedtschenkoi TaxID=63787 RepID=A0A7N0U1F3_KALFE